MKSFRTLSCILMIAVCACNQKTSKSEELFIDSIMQANYKPTGPGAVILVAKDGLPIFRKAYGLASLELNVPNKPEYIFRIGSISKQFTAVCVLKLAQEGKVNLRDDITKYLSDFNTHGRKISVENLLTHTSGVPSYTEKKDFMGKMMNDLSKQEIVNYFMGDSLLFEPGTDWSYSNSGYMLAALIVEKVSGLSFKEYLEQNILTPLGMHNTFLGSYDSVVVNTVSGYEAAGAGKFKPATYLSWSWPYGAGQILSNVDDLLKWDNGVRNNTILKKEWMDRARQSFVLANGQKTNYGYGWTTNVYKGVTFISHAGGINGFLSDGIEVPSKGLYIIMLTNSTTVNPGAFSSIIANRLAGLPAAENSIGTNQKTDLSAYTGVYAVHVVGGRVSTNFTDQKMYRYISLKGDKLYSQITGGPTVPLVRLEPDLFIARSDNTNLRFNRNESKAITSLESYNTPIQYGPNQMEPKTTLPLPKERPALNVDSNILKSYIGTYNFEGGLLVKITAENNKLFIQATGQDKEQLFAETPTKFYLKKVDVTVEFVSENNKIVKMLLNQGGIIEGRKIE